MSDDPLRLNSTATWSGEDDAGAPRPARSTPVDEVLGTRYVLAEELGRGGMAVVHAAHDRHLGRRVAVKLLRPDRAGQSDGARLYREAQALAQLRHPNVVTVFDAGSHDDQIFVAMELVDGQSLRTWMSAERRPWRDVVQKLVGAGRGLAAAHDAGLVHRDFKPDNVLLERDGTPRVADFGLARFASDAPEAGGTPSGESLVLDRTITRAGGIVGTPQYLAPEVMRGAVADARSDQFSFGVSLAEALTGARPFRGDTLEELLRDMLGHAPRVDGIAPAWLRAVVERTMAREPADRFPSMKDVIAALDRDSDRPARRRWLMAGGAVVAAAVVATGALVMTRGEQAPPSCDALVPSLAGVWDAPRRGAIARQVGASPLPFAPAIGADIARALDAYAGAIADAERATCEAQRRRNDPAAVSELRRTCLARKRAELGALADELSRIDDKGLPRAPRAISRLSPVAECGDVAALQRPTPLPADASRAEITEVLAAVDRGRIVSLLGRPLDAAKMLEPLVARARATGHAPTEAEALLAYGSVLEAIDRLVDGEANQREAFLAAQRGHSDELVARSATMLAFNVGRAQKRPADGKTWAEIAIATSERMGKPPAIEAMSHFAAAVVAIGDHRADDAAALAAIALAAAERAGYDDIATAEIVNTMGGVALDRGRFEEAGQLYARARDLSTPHLGVDHPSVQVYDSNLASVAAALGDYPRAVELRRGLLAAREKSMGPDAPRVADTRLRLAEVMVGADLVDEAVAEARRAIASLAAAGPADAPPVLAARLTLAEVYAAGGRHDEGAPIAAEVEAAAARAGAPAAQLRAAAQVMLGEIAVARGKRDEAARWYGSVVTTAATLGDTRSNALGRALLGQALLARAGGDASKARELGGRAAAILRTTNGPGSREYAAAVAVQSP
jgi:tetratricopeptide (TPR) repeat protein/predicted Ser/Thr protein kinase